MIKLPTFEDIPSLEAAAETAWANPDRRPIIDWAEDNIVLPPVFDSQFSGPFRRSKGIGRLFVPILGALQDPQVQTAVLYKPTRGSGSLIADIWMLHTIARDPGDIITDFATDDQSLDFYKTRIDPMIDLCPPVAAVRPLNRFDDSNSLVMFSNGVNLYVQSATLSHNQSKPARYLRIEELWQWKPGQLQQVLSRQKDYARLGLAKTFIQSQAGIEGDDMDSQWRLGNQQHLNVPCEKCGQYYPLEVRAERPDGSYYGLNWIDSEKTKTTDGDWLVDEIKKDFWYECPHCRHQDRRTDADAREHWLSTYRFIPSNPNADPEQVSFRYTDMICEPRWTVLKDLLLALNANNRGEIEPYKAHIQKRHAKPWSDDHRARLVKFNRYVFSDAMPDEASNVMTIDPHGGGTFWCLVWKWSKTGYSRTLWYGFLHSAAEIESKRLEYKVPNRRVGIDYAYDSTYILELCVKYGYVGLAGSKNRSFKHEAVVTLPDGRKAKKIISRPFSDDAAAIEDKVRAGASRGLLQAVAFKVSKEWSISVALRHMRSRFHAEPSACPNQAFEKQYERHQRSWHFDYKAKKLVQVHADDHFFDCARNQIALAKIGKFLGSEVMDEDESEA